MKIKSFYLSMAVVGTLIPWLFFSYFFALHGPDILLFLQSLFVNGAAGGFSTDVFITIFIFWVWSWRDAAKCKVARWWLVLPASLLVGLSLALPLYLYLRERNELAPQE